MTKICNTKKVTREKSLLMLSSTAFLLMTTPAWIPGMAAALGFALVICLAIWRFLPDRQTFRDLIQAGRWGVLGLGLLVCAAFGSNFYNTWMDSRYTQRLAQMLQLPLEWILGLCTIIAVLLCLPAVTCLLWGGIRLAAQELGEKKADIIGKAIPGKQALWLLLLGFVVGFSAVLRTNFYYLDDNGRAAFGYKTWDYFGRYISTGFSTLLHMGDYLVDIAPLPQLLALLILAFSGILLLSIFYDRRRFALWELAAVIPLGLNPYFLECLSFRFDAPYMAFSVLAGILPLIYRKREGWVYVLASALGVIGVCTSYQAATGIFPMLVIALALQMWTSGTDWKQVVQFCGKSVAGYGLGLVYFKLVIMKPADAGYVSNALPEASGLISNTIGNLKTYFGLVLTDFKPFWLLLVLLTAAVFLLLTVSHSKRNKFAAGILTCAALGLMLLLCFGIYPVLESTLFSPRAMYGFGVFLTILCVVTVQGWERLPVRMPALLLSWTFFVFSFTYGNALNLQKEFTEFRIQMVMEDLNDLPLSPSEEKMLLRLSGNIGRSPILGNMPQNYQMLNRLVPDTFAGGDDLTEYRFYQYYGLQEHFGYGSIEDCPEDMPILKEGLFHTIRGEENRILIELK